jgi:glycosyltransferase involved in cell wall biosynthesis
MVTPAIPSPILPVGNFDYLIIVGTLEPRKNHLLVIDAWERVRARLAGNLKLVFVGNVGWRCDNLLRRVQPLVDRGDVYLVENLSTAELQLLYRNAKATICASFSEGFNFTGIEAMACRSPVLASDIPVHKEVFDDGAFYFSPYSVSELESLIHKLTSELSLEARRSLTDRGIKVARRYTQAAAVRNWNDFLQRFS